MIDHDHTQLPCNTRIRPITHQTSRHHHQHHRYQLPNTHQVSSDEVKMTTRKHDDTDIKANSRKCEERKETRLRARWRSPDDTSAYTDTYPTHQHINHSTYQHHQIPHITLERRKEKSSQHTRTITHTSHDHQHTSPHMPSHHHIMLLIIITSTHTHNHTDSIQARDVAMRLMLPSLFDVCEIHDDDVLCVLVYVYDLHHDTHTEAVSQSVRLCIHSLTHSQAHTSIRLPQASSSSQASKAGSEI